ncbi:AAA family ATPase [Pectobacterium versatile]|uniref:AAA family ATPase n=1 Tax=Pectobacterium versatile TaxID=2488639 RepID=UPI001F00DCD6|nr:ATP-binding protein [Pectobacterium versatile]
MSGVRIVIDKLRGVDSFDFEFPINNGINLICGPNGVGKSTVMSAFAKIVYADALNKYFKMMRLKLIQNLLIFMMVLLALG